MFRLTHSSTLGEEYAAGVFRNTKIAARMKEIHELGGCEREAYAPIVGAGFNSTVLHYSVLDAQIKDGDVVVMDVGGEYGGYAADITRTIPANGKIHAATAGRFMTLFSVRKCRTGCGKARSRSLRRKRQPAANRDRLH